MYPWATIQDKDNLVEAMGVFLQDYPMAVVVGLTEYLALASQRALLDFLKDTLVYVEAVLEITKEYQVRVPQVVDLSRLPDPRMDPT